MSRDGLNLNLSLSPDLTRRIEDELADHIACADEVQSDSPPASDTFHAAHAAGVIRERLARPSILRRLASPHIVDQVSYTLCRKPTRAECREFAWLLFWFALVYASDLIAVSRSFSASYRDSSGWVYIPYIQDAKIPESYELVALTVIAWLLSAIARAGFFMQFGSTFVRAYRAGFGVMMARLIQLKLLHTIIVTLGLAFLPQAYADKWEMYMLWQWKGGSVLNAWTILVALALSMVLLALAIAVRRRNIGANAQSQDATKPHPDSARSLRKGLSASIVALCFFVLAFFFLYQGAPTHIKEVKYDYTPTRPEVDLNKIITVNLINTESTPFAYLGQYSTSRAWLTRNKVIKDVSVADTWWSMPFTKAGAGLGWLAFPIPLMGFLSLLAMWWILGRRSVWDAILYGIMVFYAFWGTIGPFLFGSPIPIASANEFFVGSPLPCFDGVFQSMLLPERYNSLVDFWRVLFGETFPIIFAFFFSALIPWLMVGLFARTKPKGGTRDIASE